MAFTGINTTGNLVIAGTAVASAADKTKLDGIEALADVTDVANVNAALGSTSAVAVTDTGTAGNAGKIIKLDGSGLLDGRNADADGTKLDGIETAATADQTAGEIEAIVNHDNLVGYSAAKHLATGDNREVATVQTTNATPGNVWTKTLADNTLYKVRVSVIARDQAGTERALYEREVLVYRQGAGAATIEGSVSGPVTVESNAALDCDLVVAGNDVKAQVTGLAATTIDWKAVVDWHSQA